VTVQKAIASGHVEVFNHESTTVWRFSCAVHASIVGTSPFDWTALCRSAKKSRTGSPGLKNAKWLRVVDISGRANRSPLSRTMPRICSRQAGALAASDEAVTLYHDEEPSDPPYLTYVRSRREWMATEARGGLSR
jgi:hypothetical protein